MSIKFGLRAVSGLCARRVLYYRQSVAVVLSTVLAHRQVKYADKTQDTYLHHCASGIITMV